MMKLSGSALRHVSIISQILEHIWEDNFETCFIHETPQPFSQASIHKTNKQKTEVIVLEETSLIPEEMSFISD